jgi:hypothetical protein
VGPPKEVVVEVVEEVAVRPAQDVDADGEVVVLERGLVVVPDGQRRPRIDLIPGAKVKGVYLHYLSLCVALCCQRQATTDRIAINFCHATLRDVERHGVTEFSLFE